MAGITLEQAEAQLALYLDAEAKILAGQRVTMNGKELARADLAAVQTGVATWLRRVQLFGRSATGLSVREVIPR